VQALIILAGIEAIAKAFVKPEEEVELVMRIPVEAKGEVDGVATRRGNVL
jgi:hypothetical protein